jgi:hypothetical protein
LGAQAEKRTAIKRITDKPRFIRTSKKISPWFESEN